MDSHNTSSNAPCHHPQYCESQPAHYARPALWNSQTPYIFNARVIFPFSNEMTGNTVLWVSSLSSSLVEVTTGCLWLPLVPHWLHILEFLGCPCRIRGWDTRGRKHQGLYVIVASKMLIGSPKVIWSAQCCRPPRPGPTAGSVTKERQTPWWAH